jgi:uncharacterized protein
MGIVFAWDDRKAEANRKKHGVGFDEAQEIFGDSLSLTVADPAHSKGEERFVTVGQSRKGELFVVVHADKGETIRIISARRATAKERKDYEQDAGQG